MGELIPPDDPAPDHLDPATERPTYAQLAEGTDEAVTDVLHRLRHNYPEHTGAAVAGAVAAVTRYQMQALGPSVDATAVLGSIAPMVRQMASQLVEARARAPTLPGLGAKQGLPPMQLAFQTLNSHVKEAAVPTFVIFSPAITLALVSLYLSPRGILAWASLPDLGIAVAQPSELIAAHVEAAFTAWDKEVDDGR